MVKRVTIFWATSRTMFSFALFMLLGAICAWVYLAVHEEVKQISFSTSQRLADFLSDKSQTAIDLTPKQLTASVYSILLRESKLRAPESRSITIPEPPSFSVYDGMLEAGLRISFNLGAKTVKSRLVMQFVFDGAKPQLKSAYFGEARIPLFIARKILKNISAAYALPENGFAELKKISVVGSKIRFEK